MVPNFLGGLKRKSLDTASPEVTNSAVVGCVILVTLPGLFPEILKRFVETISPCAPIEVSL